MTLNYLGVVGGVQVIEQLCDTLRLWSPHHEVCFTVKVYILVCVARKLRYVVNRRLFGTVGKVTGCAAWMLTCTYSTPLPE